MPINSPNIFNPVGDAVLSSSSNPSDLVVLPQTVITDLTNADIIAMKYDDEPITLVNKVDNKIIVPIGVTILCTYVAPTEIQKVSVYVGYDAGISTVNYFWDRILNPMFNFTTDASYITSGGIPANLGVLKDSAALGNQPLKMWSSIAFLGGFTARVITTYVLVDDAP